MIGSFFSEKERKTRPNSKAAGESARSTQTKAYELMQTGHGFVYCGAELGYGPGDFFFGDYCGWGQEQVISRDTVDAALHGINEESAGHGGGGDACGEVQYGSEGAFGFLVGYELDGPQEAQSADVADCAVTLTGILLIAMLIAVE